MIYEPHNLFNHCYMVNWQLQGIIWRYTPTRNNKNGPFKHNSQNVRICLEIFQLGKFNCEGTEQLSITFRLLRNTKRRIQKTRYLFYFLCVMDGLDISGTNIFVQITILKNLKSQQVVDVTNSQQNYLKLTSRLFFQFNIFV